MSVDPDDLSTFIQIKLRAEDRPEATAVEAAAWLDEARFLRDSKSRPGKPLRDLLRGGQIAGAEQRPAESHGHWFITRLDRSDHFVSIADDTELPRLWGMVMEEMRDRGIIHSGNSPIADIAEFAVTEHLPRAKLAPPNTPGYDVKQGRKRIQVKAARITGNRRSNLSPLRSDQFDELAVVLFDSHLAIIELMKTDRASALECCTWSPHINGHVPRISRIRKHPKTIQIHIDPEWGSNSLGA